MYIYLYYFNNQYENKMTSYWAGPRFKAWTVFWFKFVWRALNLVWTNVKICFWSLDLTLYLITWGVRIDLSYEKIRVSWGGVLVMCGDIIMVLNVAPKITTPWSRWGTFAILQVINLLYNMCLLKLKKKLTKVTWLLGLSIWH